MADVTAIANLALSHLGQTQIMALTDETPSARFCNTNYEQARDEVLAAHPWKFAMKRAALTALTSIPISEWSFEFQLPSDCIRVVKANSFWWYGCKGIWEVEGGKLLTNENSATIKYIWRITDATRFTPLFVEALAVKLAYKISIPLKGDESLRNTLLQQYERVTGPKARMVDAFEGRPAIIPAFADSNNVRSRFRSAGYTGQYRGEF